MQPQRVFELEMSDSDYGVFAAFVERHLGIQLPPEKRALVARRMRAVVGRSGQGSFHRWVKAALSSPSSELLSELADALTTNHTHFWREPEHLEHLRDCALPERMATNERSRDLRVWCAAAATGEEPYQLAMILRDALSASSGWKGGLLATDISEKALATARAGIYPADRLSGLPEPWLRRYVSRSADGSGVMAPALRNDITFRRLNLLGDSWPFRAPFDIIFCRNVLIYFDPPTRERTVGKLVRWLAPGGFLYVGHSESIPSQRWSLVSQGASIWKRPGGVM